MTAVLLALQLANGLIVQPPQQMVVQQMMARNVDSFSIAVNQPLGSAAVFPSSSFLIASSATDKIEAAKAAAAAKKAAFQGGAKEPDAPATSGKAVVQKIACPDDLTLLSQGSGKSGNMVSKTCSAQLNSRRAQAAQDAANARKLEVKRAAARANSGPAGLSLPKLPF